MKMPQNAARGFEKKVQKLLDAQPVNGFGLKVHGKAVCTPGGYWKFVVRPDRDDVSVLDYTEKLVDAEDAVRAALKVKNLVLVPLLVSE